jgi:hypothetical protein
MVHHIVGEIALTAIGARVGVVALNVAILAAGNIFGRAGRDVVGAAVRIVIAACIGHGRLSSLKTTGEERREEQKYREAGFQRPLLHSNFTSVVSASSLQG